MSQQHGLGMAHFACRCTLGGGALHGVCEALLPSAGLERHAWKEKAKQQGCKTTRMLPDISVTSANVPTSPTLHITSSSGRYFICPVTLVPTRTRTGFLDGGIKESVP